MKRISLLNWILSLALLLGLTSCGVEQAAPQPTATPEPVVETALPQAFALPVTEGGLHPILGTGKVNLALSGLLWEGLFALDQSFVPQGVLCQSHTVAEDGLSWTFVLRSGVTFSDGSPLTTAEVADSLNLARSDQSRFASRLAGIQGVSAEEGSVTITLRTPNGALPSLLDIPIVKGEGDVPLGTGPYVLQEGDPSRLSARTGWWQGKALPIQSIPLRTIQEADDLIYAFDTGEISLVTTDLTGTSALGFAGDYEVWDYPATTMVYIGYNANRGPCADAALRRALDRGFDRTTVANSLYSRHAQEATLPVPPSSQWYNAALGGERNYSPQALAEGLGAAGYAENEEGVWSKGRRPLELTFVANTDNTFRLAVAEYLVKELTEAGLVVELQKLSWSDYQKALSGGDFDLYLAAATLSADFDPAPLVSGGGALNFGRFQSHEVARLLSIYQVSTGAARAAASQALWRGLGTEVPFTTLCFKNQSVLTRWGAVTGLKSTQQNPFFGIESWSLGT